jgi:hypothetical protein
VVLERLAKGIHSLSYCRLRVTLAQPGGLARAVAGPEPCHCRG